LRRVFLLPRALLESIFIVQLFQFGHHLSTPEAVLPLVHWQLVLYPLACWPGLCHCVLERPPSPFFFFSPTPSWPRFPSIFSFGRVGIVECPCLLIPLVWFAPTVTPQDWDSFRLACFALISFLTQLPQLSVSP